MRWTGVDWDLEMPNKGEKVLWIKGNGKMGYGRLWLCKLRGITHWRRVAGLETRNIFLHAFGATGKNVTPFKVPEQMIESAEDVRWWMEQNGLDSFGGLATYDGP